MVCPLSHSGPLRETDIAVSTGSVVVCLLSHSGPLRETDIAVSTGSVVVCPLSHSGPLRETGGAHRAVRRADPCLSLDLTILSVFSLGALSGFFNDLLHWFGLMASASGCVFMGEQVLAR